MNRTRTYKVAGHVFRFTFPDNDKLWGAFEKQYAPFECNDSGQTPIFSLSLTDKLPEGQRECVYDVPTEDGETVVRLFRSGTDWIFESAADHRLPVCATVWASGDFSEATIYLHTRHVVDAGFGINNAAMLLFTFATAKLNTIEMHASVIENSGKAYLFLGKSGTGKSTHSSLWLKHIEGSELMNDDNPVVRVWEDGSIIAYGTPWSGKTPCYRNVSAPVGAYVQIRQCPENRISKMSVLNAYTSLYSSVSGIKDDDSEMADGINDTLDRILSSIPVYLLDCRPDKEAAELCAGTVR